MRYTSQSICALAATLIAFASLAERSNGAIVVTITEVGPDIIMTATGTYDVSALTANGHVAALGAVASIDNDLGIYGWETSFFQNSYTVSFSGTLTSSGTAVNATSVTGSNPFFFDIGNSEMAFYDEAPTQGSVNETATFANLSLADLGMVAGETITVTWTGDSATISTIAIPEPSSLLLVGLGTLGLAAHRRRTK